MIFKYAKHFETNSSCQGVRMYLHCQVLEYLQQIFHQPLMCLVLLKFLQHHRWSLTKTNISYLRRRSERAKTYALFFSKWLCWTLREDVKSYFCNTSLYTLDLLMNWYSSKVVVLVVKACLGKSKTNSVKYVTSSEDSTRVLRCYTLIISWADLNWVILSFTFLGAFSIFWTQVI